MDWNLGRNHFQPLTGTDTFLHEEGVNIAIRKSGDPVQAIYFKSIEDMIAHQNRPRRYEVHPEFEMYVLIHLNSCIIGVDFLNSIYN